MEESFAGKSIIVTGATSGIGRAVALRFAESKARVTAIGRNQNTLDRARNEISLAGGEALAIAADVTNSDEMQDAVQQTISAFGRLDVLVNAAGHISSGTIEDTTLAAWDAMMDVNLRAAFHLMQLSVPHLAATNGNIVNVSSVTGLRSFPGVLAYCVSKAALDR